MSSTERFYNIDNSSRDDTMEIDNDDIQRVTTAEVHQVPENRKKRPRTENDKENDEQDPIAEINLVEQIKTVNVKT